MAKTKAPTSRFEPGLSTYDDLVFERQTLELNARGRVVLSRFKASDCEIVIREGVELLLVDAEFSRCRIKSTTSSSGTADAARFETCTFEGTFEGWVLGGRLEGESLRDCDFRAADLNDCEFNCCDLATQQFCGWPTLIFVAPAAHKERLLQAPWPQTGEARIWMQTLLRTRRFRNAGVGVNAEKAARWMQVESTLLRSVVDALPDVILA